MSNYNEALVEALNEREVWTYESTKEFAKEHGLKHRSVIAKVKSMGLEYQTKSVKAPAEKVPTVTKARMVDAIETALGVKVASLVKASKADLEALVPAVGAEMPDPE